MPKGDKSSYTSKQKRQAEKIEEGYEKRGVSSKEAERRAWATVNKKTGGGKKSGTGRGKKPKRSRPQEDRQEIGPGSQRPLIIASRDILLKTCRCHKTDRYGWFLFAPSVTRITQGGGSWSWCGLMSIRLKR